MQKTFFFIYFFSIAISVLKVSKFYLIYLYICFFSFFHSFFFHFPLLSPLPPPPFPAPLSDLKAYKIDYILSKFFFVF